MADFFNLLIHSLGLLAFFVVLLAGIVIIPFGLPGTLLQAAAAIVLVLTTGGAKMSWLWVGIFMALALLGELIEFLSGQWGAKKFGGSKQAAWGALIGGLFRAIFGTALIPIPIAGSIIASFIGTFAGAVIGQMREEKTKELKLRVGFGAVLGRAAGVAFKLFIALVIFIASVVLVAKG